MSLLRPGSLDSHENPRFATLAPEVNATEDQRQRERRQRRERRGGERYSAACDTPVWEELWRQYPSWATGKAREQAGKAHIQPAAHRFPVPIARAPKFGQSVRGLAGVQADVPIAGEQEQRSDGTASELSPSRDPASSTAAQIAASEMASTSCTSTAPAPSSCFKPIPDDSNTVKSSRHVIATLEDPGSTVGPKSNVQSEERSARDSGPTSLFSEVATVLSSSNYEAQTVSNCGGSAFLSEKVPHNSTPLEDGLDVASSRTGNDVPSQIAPSCDIEDHQKTSAVDGPTASIDRSELSADLKGLEPLNSNVESLISSELGPLRPGELYQSIRRVRVIKRNDGLRVIPSDHPTPPHTEGPDPLVLQSLELPISDGKKVALMPRRESVFPNVGPGERSLEGPSSHTEQDHTVPSMRYDSFASRQPQHPLLRTDDSAPSAPVEMARDDGRFRSWGRSITKSMSRPFRRLFAIMRRKWSRQCKARTSSMRHWRRYRKGAYRSGQPIYDETKKRIAKRRTTARQLLRKKTKKGAEADARSCTLVRVPLPKTADGQRLTTERQRTEANQVYECSGALPIGKQEVVNFSYPLHAGPNVTVIQTPQEALPSPETRGPLTLRDSTEEGIPIAISSTVAEVGERQPVIRRSSNPPAFISQKHIQSGQDVQQPIKDRERRSLAERIEMFKPAELESYNDLVKSYTNFSVHRDMLCEMLRLTHKDVIKLHGMWKEAYHATHAPANVTGDTLQSMKEAHTEKMLTCMRDAIESFRFWEGKVSKLKGDTRSGSWKDCIDLNELGQLDLTSIEKEMEMFAKRLKAVHTQRDAAELSKIDSIQEKSSVPSLVLRPAPSPVPATTTSLPVLSVRSEDSLALALKRNQQRRPAIPEEWRDNKTETKDAQQKPAPEVTLEKEEERLSLSSLDAIPKPQTTNPKQQIEEYYPRYRNLSSTSTSLSNGTQIPRLVGNDSSGKDHGGSLESTKERSQVHSTGRAAGRRVEGNSTSNSTSRPPPHAPTEPRAMREAANARSRVPSYTAPTASSLRNARSPQPPVTRSVNSSSLGRRGGRQYQLQPTRSRIAQQSAPVNAERRPQAESPNQSGRRTPSQTVEE